MSNIFEFKVSASLNHSQQNLKLKVARPNQMKCDEKSLRTLGPKLYNNLPHHVKNAENLFAFKQLMRTWDVVHHGALCKWNLCRKQ